MSNFSRFLYLRGIYTTEYCPNRRRITSARLKKSTLLAIYLCCFVRAPILLCQSHPFISKSRLFHTIQNVVSNAELDLQRKHIVLRSSLLIETIHPEIWSENNREVSITIEICITIDFAPKEKFLEESQLTPHN